MERSRTSMGHVLVKFPEIGVAGLSRGSAAARRNGVKSSSERLKSRELMLIAALGVGVVMGLRPPMKLHHTRVYTWSEQQQLTGPFCASPQRSANDVVVLSARHIANSAPEDTTNSPCA